MRILYVTQYFPPEQGAPQVRIPELMRHLIALGHDVTILTAMPNYPTGRIFPEYRGRWRMVEQVEQMRVVRAWMYPTTSVGFLKRTWSQLSFAIMSGLLGPGRLGRYDVMLVGSPPLFLALCARWLRFRLGCPYVMVVADLWPEVAIATGMLTNPYAIRLATRLEKMFYKHALAVVTQTPGQAENIRSRYPNTLTHVVSGAVDTKMFSPELRSDEIRRTFGVDRRIGVLYFGLHGFAQGLDVVLDAAAHLKHRPDIHFVMIGSGAVKDGLVARAQQLELHNLRFFDPVDRARIPAIVASMDIGLVSLRPGVPQATMPTKMYEIMASGKPIIVAADGESPAFVKHEKIGLAAPAGAGERLTEAIVELADDPDKRCEFGRRGLALARERFDRAASAHTLHEFLLEHVGQSADSDSMPAGQD